MNIHERMKIIFLGIIALICTYAYSMPITVCTRADDRNAPIYATKWGIGEKAYARIGFEDVLPGGFDLPGPGWNINSSCSVINVPDKQPPFTIHILLHKVLLSDNTAYPVTIDMAPVTFNTHDELNNCKILIAFRSHDEIMAGRYINMSLSSPDVVAFRDKARAVELYKTYSNRTALIRKDGKDTMNCDGTAYW